MDLNSEIDLPQLHVLITTNDLYIEGELILPETIKFDSSIPDNILFYVINGGFQFITIRNCEVKDRKNLAFRPDNIPQMHINISSIITIQILRVSPDDYETYIFSRRKEDRQQQIKQKID